MKRKNQLAAVLFTVLTFGSTGFAQVAADNSKVNEGDASENALTADQQKSNASDTDITARIRRDIMTEKNFSTYAQNIKIITVNGRVILKGPVRTSAEESAILKHARAVAGTSNVVNEISVTPEKK